MGFNAGVGRQTLRDGDRVIAVYESVDVHDRPTAEAVELRVPVEAAVPVLLCELSGQYLTSPDDALVDALVAAGATVARHAHVYSHVLGGVEPEWREPSLPGGLRVTPIDRPASKLAPVELAAYPPEHPDHEFDDPEQVTRFVQQMLDGQIVGPFLGGASGLVVDGERPVALLVVNRMPGAPPLGGPWVTDVAREPDPRYRGLGAVLLRRALAVLRASGETAFGLAVTDGNPVHRVYEELGFRRVSSARRLLLP